MEGQERQLKEAAVPATISRYDGMVHGFAGMPFNKGKQAISEACAML